MQDLVKPSSVVKQETWTDEQSKYFGAKPKVVNHVAKSEKKIHEKDDKNPWGQFKNRENFNEMHFC